MAGNDYLSVRRRIYRVISGLRDFSGADAASQLLQIQLELADAITVAEANEAEADPGSFNRHLFLLRRCVDNLAFRLLDPHALRQLASLRASGPPGIVGQGDSFKATLEAAKRYAEKGHLVLISDLSHLVCLGDLVVCDDPVVPSIVEVKSGAINPEHLTQGRRGRQISRSLGTIKYLKGDYAHLFGQPTPKVAVQPVRAIERRWSDVRETVSAAIRSGTAVRRVSEYDTLFAVLPDPARHGISLDIVQDDLLRFRAPLVASHAVSLLNLACCSRRLLHGRSRTKPDGN